MKRVTRILLGLICVFGDTAVLPRVSLWGIAPAMLFAFAAALTLADSKQTGLIFAALGGLMIDLICNTTIGLTPALYLLALLGLAALNKRRALKPLLAFGAVSALYFTVQAIFAGGAALLGQVRPYGRELLLTGLPSSLLTGAVTVFFLAAAGKKATNDR